MGAGPSLPAAWPRSSPRHAAWGHWCSSHSASAAPDRQRDGPEPYRPIFLGVALVAMFFAYRRVFRPARTASRERFARSPQVRSTYKIIFWVVVALLLVALGFPYVLPLFY